MSIPLRFLGDGGKGDQDDQGKKPVYDPVKPVPPSPNKKGIPVYKKFKYGCFKPVWCGFKNTDMHDIAICIGAALFNINTELLHKIRCYQELGLTDKVMVLMYQLSRINHIAYYLFNVFIQIYLNNQKMEDYVCCEDLECWYERFRCEGIDISCIFECFNVCGYFKDCKVCKR